MKKKIVALMLTGVLVAGMPLTVSAATVTPGNPYTDAQWDAGPSQELDNTGTVTYIKGVKYQITLPTANSINFKLDPQGYLGSTDDYKDLYADGTTGMILAATNQGAYVRNESSVPIKMSVEAYVSKDGKATGTAANVNLMETEDYVNSGLDLNMYLTLDISNDDAAETLNKAADGTAGVALVKMDTVNQGVLPIMKNGKPGSGETGTQITFALDKGTWKVNATNDDIDFDTSAPSGDAVGLRLSGRINENADWSDFTGASPTESIYVTTLYKFMSLSVDYDNAAFDGRAHGTLEDVTPEYYAGVKEDGTPETATEAMEYTLGGEPLTIDFNLGSGKDEVTITKIEADAATTGTFVEVTNTDYKVYNNQIVFKSTGASVTANVFDKADADGNAVSIKITTSDTKVTTVPVKVYTAE